MPSDNSTDDLAPDAAAQLDALLKALPERTLDPQAEARTLRKARAVLADEPRVGLFHTLQQIWERAVAPVLVTSTVATYLVWAVHSASALYR
jgi:hypothetical protein